jgi:hypothetical protein
MRAKKKRAKKAKRPPGNSRGKIRTPGGERDVKYTRANVQKNREKILQPPALPNAADAVAAIEDTPEDVKARMGRPPVEIKWDTFELMLGDFCTLREMAATFFCSQATIERKCVARYGLTFADTAGQFRAARVGSLRRASFITALKGNATMQKHLLNNYGGTADIHRLQSSEEARKYLAELLGVAIEDLPPNVTSSGEMP